MSKRNDEDMREFMEEMKCSIDNCNNKIKAKKLCGTHYNQIRTNGLIKPIREMHGGKHTRLYTTWRNMKDRCLNKNSTFYYLYGGRGVKVHKPWVDSFIEFKKWSERHNYNDKLEIDRIDNEDGYYPDNCRFVSRVENMNNRKVSISNRFTIDELSDICEMPDRGFTIIEVTEVTGLSRASIQRLRRGVYHG